MDNQRLNARLRNICENNGIEYGPDPKDEDEVVRRFQMSMQLTQQNIREAMHKIKQAKTVDMCFLLDATISMQEHIEGVKESIKKIVKTLHKSSEKPAGIENIRFAIVAYRDFEDNVPLEAFDFSEDVNACISFCQNIKATGGGDPPEDVFGGLEKAVNLSWSPNAGTRIIFHMCDYPCHGTQYHTTDLSVDSHPNGDPKGRNEMDIFAKIKQLKIDYYFGEMTHYTSVMLTKFAVAYGRTIQHFRVEGIAQIAGSIIQSIAMSVEANIGASKIIGSVNGLQTVATAKIHKTMPTWPQVPVTNGYFIQFGKPTSISGILNDEPLNVRNTTGVKLKIAPNPFAEGSERLAYHAQEVHDTFTKSLVLKKPRSKGKADTSLSRSKNSCEVQTIAGFFAEEFNKTSGNTIKLNFIETKVFVASGSLLPPLSCESYFGANTHFIKFTNNLDFTIETNQEEMKKLGLDPTTLDVITAFSHWTWHKTDGFLIVVDLQGCIVQENDQPKLLMTDPAIHSKDVTRFHPTNLGPEGIKEFFRTHHCNDVCRSLKISGQRL